MRVKDLQLRAVQAYKFLVKVAGRWISIGFTYATNLWAAYERARRQYNMCPVVTPVEA